MQQYSLESKECHPGKAQIMRINEHVLHENVWITAVLLTHINNNSWQNLEENAECIFLVPVLQLYTVPKLSWNFVTGKMPFWHCWVAEGEL